MNEKRTVQCSYCGAKRTDFIGIGGVYWCDSTCQRHYMAYEAQKEAERQLALRHPKVVPHVRD